MIAIVVVVVVAVVVVVVVVVVIENPCENDDELCVRSGYVGSEYAGLRFVGDL
jgi:hypothetical protein